MRSVPLRLAEGHILVEQVRLLCGNVRSSVIPTFLLLGLIYWVVSDGADPVDETKLAWWCALTAISKLVCWLHARRQLWVAISETDAPRLVAILMLLNGMDGLIWGLLPWVALTEPLSLAGTVLTMAVLTGVAANSMSLLSPVVPVFVVFVVLELSAGASKLLSMGESAYTALAIAGVLYAIIMIGQAINSARTSRTSIDLRFENINLLEKLRRETKIAECARHDAEEAALAKSKFLAAASHDLRQPIHAQGLFLEVLRTTELTPYQREVLASACSASLASGEMLDMLLDFSRLEAGVAKPFIQSFQLQLLLHKIENDLAPMADAKGLVYRSRECPVAIKSDATMVELILRNLVSNAIRYTGKGGVLVGCRRRGQNAIVEVWDTGIGIAPESHQEIFREFHQLGNPERDRRRGLGLGLAIADGMAKALGHKLSLMSRPGRGTVFRLELPLCADDAVTVMNLDLWSARADQLQGLQVLAIDDDDTVLAGMAWLMRSWGCKVTVADSISQALELAAVQAPDLIVSDYRLRGHQTGAEGIAALREFLGAAVPALIITGDTAPERLREAVASGVPLLHKPVVPDELYRVLMRLRILGSARRSLS